MNCKKYYLVEFHEIDISVCLWYYIYGIPRKKQKGILTCVGKDMKLKDKIKTRRIDKYWEKQGRKDLFTWVHRYLRLHNELLVDNVYQNIYDYYRSTLILYLKKDVRNKKLTDEKLGELVDVLADIFNKDAADRVDEYKVVVDELYKSCKEYPDILGEIHI